MKFTTRLNEAIKLASNLHRNQTRKDENRTPYASHLFSVALIINEVTDDEDIIISGLMHDSLEDIEDYTYEKLVEDCGNRVADIVKGVTEIKEYSFGDDREMKWLKTRELYIQNLISAPIESTIVSLADKIHNTENFLIDAKKEGENFTKKFGGSIKNKVWFNEEIIKIGKEKLGEDNILVKRLEESTKEMNLFF